MLICKLWIKNLTHHVLQSENLRKASFSLSISFWDETYWSIGRSAPHAFAVSFVSMADSRGLRKIMFFLNDYKILGALGIGTNSKAKTWG